MKTAEQEDVKKTPAITPKTSKLLGKNCIALAAVAISIVGVIIAIWSLAYTRKQVSLASQQAQLHIDPVIKIYFDFPEEKNPVFVVANEGYIEAVSVTISPRIFVFGKKEGKVLSIVGAGKTFSPAAMFCDTLRPTEYEHLELARSEPLENLIAVYQFDLKYFRKTDMHDYNHTEYYFVDAGQQLSHSGFRAHSRYHEVMAAIANPGVEMTEKPWPQGLLRRYLDAQASKQGDTGEAEQQ